jgi:hypothetical protein
LPQPAPPQTSVGLPRGNPPPVISSSPWMPVGHLGKSVFGALDLEPLVFIFIQEQFSVVVSRTKPHETAWHFKILFGFPDRHRYLVRN